MKPTRRTLLKSLAASAAVLQVPYSFAQAQPFPPQDQIDNDPLRPRYHLMPRRGWMNDPCAPVFFQGTYHMFFQYNPGASVWGDMHWAHSTSPDMIHWTPRPIAFAPTPGSPDSYGVWTGSVVFDRGTPTILYTATSLSPRETATIKDATPYPIREQVMLATPASPSLDSWHKLGTPVLAGPPAGMEVTGFRDPVPFRVGQSWYLLMASGERGTGGDVLLYRSPDLRSWTYLKVFAQGKPTGQKTPDTVDSGEMWECPDFFPLGSASDNMWVLIHSTGTPTGRATLWQSGRLDPATVSWRAEHEGILNHGPYYAPKSQTDAHGSRILWGWIPEDRPEAEFARAGWAGCMSLPRVLTLEDGQVRFQVAPQATTLRETAHTTGESGSRQSELVLSLERGAPERAAPERSHPAPIETDLLRIELTGAPPNALQWAGKTVPLNQPLPDKLEIRAFLDHSALELFLGNRLVLTTRVYNPDRPAILALPEGYRVTSTQSYRLKSI